MRRTFKRLKAAFGTLSDEEVVLLDCLLSTGGMPVPRESLRERLGPLGAGASLDVRMMFLRKKLQSIDFTVVRTRDAFRLVDLGALSAALPH